MKASKRDIQLIMKSTVVLVVMLLTSLMGVSAAESRDTQYDPVTSGAAFSNARVISSGGSVGTVKYPTESNLKANYVVNGQVTKRTTSFQMTLGDTFSTGSKFIFASANSFTTGIQASSGVVFPITNGNTINFNASSPTTFTLNQATFNNAGFPIYLGLGIKLSSTNKSDYFSFVKIDNTVLYPLQPTVANTTDTGISTTDTTITGKGTFAGDTITSDASSATTTVNSDLNYTLNVGSALKDKTSVKVTESPKSGNTTDTAGSATVAVKYVPKLAISSTTNDVTLQPSDYENVSGMSDSDAVAWLVKQAGITAVDQNNNNSSAGIAFASKTTGIGAAIKGLAEGDHLTIPIYATLDSATSSEVNIVVTRFAGMLSFGTVSEAVDYGTDSIPTTTKVLAPTVTPTVEVTDTRSAGSGWAVTASASELVDEGTNRILSGGLVYNDGTMDTPLTDNDVVVATSADKGGQTTVNIASGWSSTKGILLQVNPNVYVGTYKGIISWTLNDVP
ncbi:cell surface protein [Furfurilactobacillus sp. OKN36]